MMNKKGFTLIEILAVILILSLITTGSIAVVIRSKKVANDKLAVKLEDSLTAVGKSIYVHEFLSGNKEDDNYFYKKYKNLGDNESLYISLTELGKKNYLTDLKKENSNYKFKSPYGSDKTCDGYLMITKVKDAPEYKGYISCEGGYKSKDYDKNKPNDSDYVQITETIRFKN